MRALSRNLSRVSRFNLTNTLFFGPTLRMAYKILLDPDVETALKEVARQKSSTPPKWANKILRAKLETSSLLALIEPNRVRVRRAKVEGAK